MRSSSRRRSDRRFASAPVDSRNERCDATARLLQEFVKAQLAPYKYPRRVEFVDALPRTETGKLQRFRLRAGQ